MPYVKDNQTHYDTQDLEKVVKAMMKAIRSESRKGWRYISDAQEDFGVRYWKGTKKPSPAPRRQWKRMSHRAAKKAQAEEEWQEQHVSTYTSRFQHGAENLRILRFEDSEATQNPLAQIAGTAHAEKQLPDEAVAQIAAVSAFYLGIRKKGKTRFDDEAILADLLVRARQLVEESELVVRVRDKVQNPQKKKKLTSSEKAAYWLDIYENGKRAKKLRWRLKNDLTVAVRSYDMAWRETLEQKERAEKAGAVVVPHPTPAEVLRKLADDWEAEEN